jgi:2-amino-4-hydroxy-6-hydroxymethyldihydropteridine diphosphokinase
MARVFIGIGSNIGDLEANVKKALSFFPDRGIELIKLSSLLKTDPVDYIDQPRFLNCIAECSTDLAPEKLLKALSSIEQSMGRVKLIPKGPRNIDLDILLYNDLIFESEALTIPHREIRNRDFILYHLVELDRTLVDPVDGMSYFDIYKKQKATEE